MPTSGLFGCGVGQVTKGVLLSVLSVTVVPDS